MKGSGWRNKEGGEKEQQAQVWGKHGPLLEGLYSIDGWTHKRTERGISPVQNKRTEGDQGKHMHHVLLLKERGTRFW